MRHSVLFRVIFMTLCGAVCGSSPAAEPLVRLMPAPSEVQWETAVDLQGGGVILISPQATTAQKLAAELLQAHVKRRFGQEWSVSTESPGAAQTGIRVLLGQRKTFPALDAFCNEHKISVPEQGDGYALSVIANGKMVTAAVAGMNDRSVAYGQDTLFQLLSGSGSGVKVQCATIRDWPTIPMRGRPATHYNYYLKPGNMDCLVTSRINFVDIRDGIYAFDPGAKLDEETIRKSIAAARDRDLIVFAVVNCGVPTDQYDAVLTLFKKFLSLGANALWISFDDKGPGGAPADIVKRVIDLGREHGITGDRIATTPPKGSYQTIITPFDRQIMAVPGMEEAIWYWTSIPCAQDVTDARSIGMKTLPSWWHNWPRFRDGTLASGSPRTYTSVINLAEGWNHPTVQEFQEMGKYVHAVMPWGGTGAQQDYLVSPIGWWSWRPEQYDANDIRRRIYNIVFGPDRVDAGMTFDDKFDDVCDRFHFTLTHTDFTPMCPPRLRSLSDRAKALADLETMKGQLEILKREPSGSIIDPQLLQEEYLSPMAHEVASGMAEARAPFPEYWWPQSQAQILNAVYDGNTSTAQELIASTRDRVLKELSQIEQVLKPSGMLRNYLDWWKKRVQFTPEDWKKLAEGRHKELLERIDDYGKTIANPAAMLKNINDPPIQVGTGAWKRHNHVLATVLPDQREIFWGDWIGGLGEKNGVKFAAFAIERHEMVEEGAWTELPVNIPISGRRDRLALILYLADANKESFGFGYAKWRWSGYRDIRLLWNDRELWKADLGIPRINGEWFVVPLPEIPADVKTLPLRLRIDDYFSAKNNLEIVYLGPIRLLELDRD